MRSVWSRLSSKEVLGEDCAGDSWPGQWSQLWLGWGRGLSRLSQSQRQSPDTLTARKSSEDLQPTRLDWCSGVCPDHLFGRTQANQELLRMRSLSPKWGSVESLCFESHLVLVLAALFRLFHFLPDHEKGKNWQRLATGDSWVAQWHSKSLVWAQKGKASIAEQLTRVRQSWQECSVQPLHSAKAVTHPSALIGNGLEKPQQ